MLKNSTERKILFLLCAAPAGPGQDLCHSSGCVHAPGKEQAPFSGTFIVWISVVVRAVVKLHWLQQGHEFASPFNM